MNRDIVKKELNYEIDMEPQKYIFGGIFAISNRLQVIGDVFLGEVTTKQWFLIAVIGQFFKDTPPSLSEVAEIMGTSRQNVKQIGLKLEKKGFVEIKKDIKDNRVLRVQLTEKCVKYFENRYQKDEEFINTIFQGFEAEELFQLSNSLDKFYKNISSFKVEE